MTYLFFLAILFSGCLVDKGEVKTVTVTEIDTVFVKDTVLVSELPAPGAPEVWYCESEREESVSGSMQNYITVYWRETENAIGYNLYYSRDNKDGPYTKTNSGTNLSSGTGRYGIIFSLAGTYFFKATAINNDGIEGPMSPHCACVHLGY